MKILLDSSQIKALTDHFNTEITHIELSADEMMGTRGGRKNWATTMAVGEEDATTMAVGEEGDCLCYTTMAVGEEDGVSTMAIGEE